MKRIIICGLVGFVFAIALFIPAEVFAAETYQQQNYWYKVDGDKSINIALENPGEVYAARVSNGSAYVGRLINVCDIISENSVIIKYEIGTDANGMEWYFLKSGENAEWVHPVTYGMDRIEYPSELFLGEEMFTVVHIGGMGSSYRKGDYQKDNARYVSVASATYNEIYFMEDRSYGSGFDRAETNGCMGSFGNGYINSVAMSYREGSETVNSKTIEVITRYVNNTLQMVSIPETVKEIAPYTFCLCNALGIVEGCRGVEIYGEYCFAKEYTAEISTYGTHSYVHRYEDKLTTANSSTTALVIAAREFEPAYISKISFPECDFEVKNYAFMESGLCGEIELLNCVSLGKGALKNNGDITLLRVKKLKEVNKNSIEGCDAMSVEYVKEVYHYVIKPVLLEVLGNEGVKSVEGTGIYIHGMSVKVRGVAKEGWKIKGWNVYEGERKVFFEATGDEQEVLIEIHDEDIRIEFMAVPATTTPYQVRYYFENEAGRYILGYTENSYGTTGTKVVVRTDFEGFIFKEISETTIKGNGSTVVEVYFDIPRKSEEFANKTETGYPEGVIEVKEVSECKNGHKWYRGSNENCPFCEKYIKWEEYEIIEYKADIIERLYKDEFVSKSSRYVCAYYSYASGTGHVVWRIV